MISKFIPILVLNIALNTCNINPKSASVVELEQIKVESRQRELIVIQSLTTLRHGDIGIITIQGEPGVKYLLESSFSDGIRTIPVSQLRTGDSRGLATFNWVVSEDTVPGTYPITIQGGNETLTLSHTVMP